MPANATTIPKIMRNRQQGFSMMEVLIAVVVLTVGLLGGAAMQAQALSSNRDARLASVAVGLAREVGEMMRGNKNIAIDSNPGANPYLVAATGTAPSVGVDCFSSSCANPVDLAKWQMADWISRVMDALPGARVAVCYDSSPFDASGTPQWACSNSGGVAVVKIGWTKRTTAGDASTAAAFDRAATPSIVFPVLAGSTL